MVKQVRLKMVEIVFDPEQLKAMRIAPVQLRSKVIGRKTQTPQTT
jgi:predicted aspartyl protease